MQQNKNNSVEKGKLLYKTPPPSKIRKFVWWLYFIIWIIFIFTSIYECYTTPIYRNYLLWFLAGLVGTSGILLILIREALGFCFKIYENGVTKSYPNSINWIMKKDNEGRFIPYKNMIGYDITKKNVHKKRIKWITASIFALDDKEKVKRILYKNQKKTILELGKYLENAAIKEIPKRCPDCNKRIYLLDIFDGKCIKCRYEIWDKDALLNKGK